MITEEEILAILNDWNYWDKEFEKFVFRENYAERLEKVRNSGEMIVFTGIRRSGKSTMLKQEMKELAKKHDLRQILYVNFEDSRFEGNLTVRLLEKIYEVYRQNINLDKETFVFFDEIQEVEKWEKFVRTLYELKKAHIYLTGSSSKMLSSELSSLLSGRYIEIRVFPLTFGEFLDFKNVHHGTKVDLAKNRLLIKKMFGEYVQYGGFPKVVLSDEYSKKELLMNYLETILLRDIVSRYNLKAPSNIRRMANLLLTNDAKVTNLNLLRKSLNISYEAGSDYLSYFKEIFFLSELKGFDYSLKRQIKSNSKFYSVDTGLINLNAFKFSENLGFLLENIAFNQLARNFREVYYYSGKGECDFVAKSGTKVVSAIQVCYVLNSENKKRELNGLLEAMEKFKLKEGLILTYNQEDEISEGGRKISVLPMWKWLIAGGKDNLQNEI